MKKIIIVMICILTFFSCDMDVKTSNGMAQNQDSSKFEASIKRGKIVYNDMCITCHLDDGKGVPKVFPSFAGSDNLKKNRKESIKAAKFGMSGEIQVNGVTYNSVMAPLGLSDEEVADVINYIHNS